MRMCTAELSAVLRTAALPSTAAKLLWTANSAGGGLERGFCELCRNSGRRVRLMCSVDNDAFYKANGVLVLCNGMRKP